MSAQAQPAIPFAQRGGGGPEREAWGGVIRYLAAMAHRSKITVSKLDAARRQLETAVVLYFAERDPVSIHTLTAAAYNVLRDIGRARKTSPMLIKEQALAWVQPEHVSSIRKKINEAENFFKHADKDPEGEIEFSPEQTELLLFDACTQYRTLVGESLPLLMLFSTWFIIHHPDIIISPSPMADAIRAVTPLTAGRSRAEYFHELLPLITALPS